jgi:hypothetical protein
MADEAEVTADGAVESNNGAAGLPAGKPSETAAEKGKSRADRASSGAIDMDIDEDSPNPVAQPAPIAKPNGTSTFNVDQEDFIAFDMSDDEDFGQKSVPPKTAFANKGKGKESNEAMVSRDGTFLGSF